MTWIKNLALAALLCFASATPASALEPDQGKRPVTTVFSLEYGAAHNMATYLSPLWYDGWGVALSGLWTKDFQRWSDRCVMRFEANLDFQSLLNPAKSARETGATAYFGWGMAWRCRPARGLQIHIGPMIDLYGGALYQPRNGNNPANALAYAGLDISAGAKWEMRWGRLPVELADEVRLPSAGAFFCPGYGESYYEIYLGNHRDLAHFGWWGNAFGVDNLLALRMKLGRTGMQIGYRLSLRTFKANNLETQLMRNAVVIGIIP